MNKTNLTARIWLSFIALIILLGILIAVIYPLSIQDTLTEETYQIILHEQNRLINPFVNDELTEENQLGFIERREAARSVGHALINHNGGRYRGDPIPEDVFKEMGQNAFSQTSEYARYKLKYEEATLFYIIQKVYSSKNDAYLISYMWDTYRNQMVQQLWKRLLVILLIASFVSLFPALWLARYLQTPLKVLGNRFEQIAKRNWKEPFQWEGGKEFARLSEQFELMRQNLIRYDESQKTFIQHASHELKTPIMIINSYAQAIKDGVLPKGNLHDTMDVILLEAGKMDHRIRAMIYYSKLGALLDEQGEKRVELVRVGLLANEIEERFRYQREDVRIIIQGEDVTFQGDEEQIEILLDNLVQNAIRHAHDLVIIQAVKKPDSIMLSVYNNGAGITNFDREKLFKPFQKGREGEFGLGLAIAKQITELHDGTIFIDNQADGIAFCVKLPNMNDKNANMVN